MKLLKALFNRFRTADAKAAEALTNPVDNAALAIEDSKKQVAKFEQAIVGAVAQNRMLKKRLADTEGDITKYQNIAKLAAGKSDDDAWAALAKKNELVGVANSLKAEIVKNDTLIENQKHLLERAHGKIDSAESDKEILAARLAGAEARKDMAKAEGAFNQGGGLAALGDLKNAVAKEESQAEAWEEVTKSGEPTLEEKYSVSSQSVEDELAALKANK